jgi:hypothetical protein
MGKKFLGESMNKKTAKFNSAAAAWAEFGAGTRHQLHQQPIQNQSKSKKKHRLNKRLLPRPRMVSKKKAKSLRGHYATF